MKNKIRILLKYPIKDLLLTISISGVVFLVCYIIHNFIPDSESYSSLLFLLAIFLVSRFTRGYLFGLISAVVGSFIVNYAFTAPYFELSFSIPGYIITFVIMLLVSVLTSVLTTKVIEEEEIKVEAEKEKIKSNFLRSISHDLRTPLTTILGNSNELIKSNELTPEDKKTAVIIHDEAETLLGMVENVLSISRINSELKLNTRNELVEELLENAVHEIKGRYPDIRILVQIPDKILFVNVDSKLILQVLLNLLENAYIHGKSDVPITLFSTYDNKYVYINIKDYGTGIDDVNKYLNESAYFNVDSQNKYQGIGLSVSNTIIKLHGGIISAKNNDDKGATFTIKLPVVIEDEK